MNTNETGKNETNIDEGSKRKRLNLAREVVRRLGVSSRVRTGATIESVSHTGETPSCPSV